MSDESQRGSDVPEMTQLRDGFSETNAPTISMDSPVGSAAINPAVGKWAVASRFEPVAEIGTGGMGAVAEVHDQLLLRRVAMKTIHAEIAQMPQHTQRFLEEVQITAQLDHPNIVPVHDVGFHDDGATFFVMKLVAGETLHTLIQRRAELPLTPRAIEEFISILIKVCDAISFAHSRGVIHRDLKPANIMVGNYGQVYVMDWGIALLQGRDRARADAGAAGEGSEGSESSELRVARSTESHRQSGASLMGTAAYMAPEQANAAVDAIDERTDVFGLGGILYEILTGRPPYVADNSSVQLQMAREGKPPHPMRVTDRKLPPALCRIAMKAMSTEHENRYQTVDAVKDDLAAFVRGGGWFDTLEFPPGAVIVREGDDADAAFIIERGQCEVYKLVDGERHVLRHLGPGDVFGETAIFADKPRTATVVAKTGVKVAAITRQSLDYELAEKQWLSVFVKALAERFRELDAEMVPARKRDPRTTLLLDSRAPRAPADPAPPATAAPSGPRKSRKP